MSSSSRPPRSRYRFGFRGKRPRRNAEATTTTDEILDSLTRQARLMEKDGAERTLGLNTILEVEPGEELLQSRRPEADPIVEGLKSWNFGKLAFAIMLVGGLTLLWIYSRLSQSASQESLARLQETISRAGFTDWQKIALMAICAFAIALLVRRSTGKIHSRIISTV
ncbi:MAG TPA: hypothetical protein VNA15_04430 [Candidatus Angelobacter sp.]|nr:hypothetical protein [Candidatus Angelobacter sp.]